MIESHNYFNSRIGVQVGIFLLASCANIQKVWDRHDPNEYLQVAGTSSIEEEIKAKAVKAILSGWSPKL
jgi:uncharacterized lipoprotein YajG